MCAWTGLKCWITLRSRSSRGGGYGKQLFSSLRRQCQQIFYFWNVKILLWVENDIKSRSKSVPKGLRDWKLRVCALETPKTQQWLFCTIKWYFFISFNAALISPSTSSHTHPRTLTTENYSFFIDSQFLPYDYMMTAPSNFTMSFPLRQTSSGAATRKIDGRDFPKALDMRREKGAQ